MNSLCIEGDNVRIIKAPPGQKNVVDFHVAIEGDCLVSHWEPTPRELALLNAGGCVELWIVGEYLPSMAMHVVPHTEIMDEEKN